MGATYRLLLLTLFSVAFLAACGGGGGGGMSTTAGGGGSGGGGGVVTSSDSVLRDGSGGITAVVVRTTNGVTAAASTFETAEYNLQYGLDKMGAAEAYSRGYFGQGVTVAIVDTGFRTDHSDLSGQFLAGTNVAEGNNDVSDTDGHGTHVAGIIGAKLNGVSMHGVAPQAKLMPIRAARAGSGIDNGEAGIRYALERNVQVINNSWGAGEDVCARGGTYQTTVRVRGVCMPLTGELLNAVKGDRGFGARTYNRLYNWAARLSTYAHDKDSVVVWATGNHGYNAVNGSVVMTLESSRTMTVSTRDFVTHYTNSAASWVSSLSMNGADAFSAAPFFQRSLLGKWVAVVATDRDNRIAEFSNGCGATKYWCIAAPGVDITSTDRGSATTTGTRSGTSMAAPQVSGALAVLKSRFPSMPMRAIVFILLKTATDLGERGVDDVYGHGLVNLARAITVQGSVNLIIPDGEAGSFSHRVSVTSSHPLYDDSGRLTAVFLAPANRVTAAASTFETDEYNLQYGLDKIGAAEAYRRGYYGQGVTVAVLDNGFNTTHRDLRDQFIAGTNVATGGTDVSDSDGHGSHVAGIIAAKMDGNRMHGVAPQAKILPIKWADAEGDAAGTEAGLRYALNKNVHVINNSWGLTQSFCDSGTYQVTIQIMRVCIPLTAEWLNVVKNDGGRGMTLYNNLRAWSARMATAADDKDTVLVWAASNVKWNSVNGRIMVFKGTLSVGVGVTTTVLAGIGFANPVSLVNHYVSHTHGTMTVLNPNGADYENLAPLFQRSLIGKWVAVVNTDSSNTIYSGGCGAAKHWCIAAPGTDITSTYMGSDTSVSEMSGTSMAAPHVSGALAVLKSRFPTMPMSVVLFILFKTATDLGERGVDDVYGHGLVNLARAITVQGNVDLVIPTDPAGTFRSARLRTSDVGDKPRSTSSVSDNSTRVLLKDSRMALSALLGHLKPRLDKVSVGANMLGVYYYNTPIGGLVTQQQDALPVLGNGAAELLSPRREVLRDEGSPFSFVVDKTAGQIVSASWQSPYLRLRWQVCARCTRSVWQSAGDSRPFYAHSQQALEAAFRFGKKWELFTSSGFGRRWSERQYDQVGVRFQHVGAGWGLRSAFSLVREDDSFMGGDYEGGFAVAGSDTYQGRIRLHKALAAGWQGYVDYRGGEINGRVAGRGSMIKALSAVRFSDWRIGLTGQGLWRPDDALHLSLQQRGVLHSGDMQLRYGVASGRAVEDADTKMSFQRGYEVVNRSLPLASSGITQLRIGYALQPAENTRLAVAVERELGGETALSAQLRWSF